MPAVLSEQPKTIDKRSVIERVQAELDAQRENLPDYRKGLDAKWEAKTAEEPGKFIGRDGKIMPAALESFRRLALFVPDTPYTDYRNPLNVRNWLDGIRRGQKQMVIDAYDRLSALGHLDMLKKYPSPEVGKPYHFHWKGTRLTYRWHKHIHFISLVNKHLRSKLAPDFVGLDLGSSYGIFSSLLKREFPKSVHILVDFPEQLLLAYYYLASYIPGARIAGVREITAAGRIDREFLKSYDFVLVPVTFYDKISAETVDLYTNFASLGEMRREWFEGYLSSPVFKTARFFFCANRYESAPTYDTDVTVVDYPVWDPQKRIHFTTCPVFSHMYVPKLLFSFEKLTYGQYFEYIGRIADKP